MWWGARTGGRRTSVRTGSPPATEATTVAARAASSSRSGSSPGSSAPAGSCRRPVARSAASRARLRGRSRAHAARRPGRARPRGPRPERRFRRDRPWTRSPWTGAGTPPLCPRPAHRPGERHRDGPSGPRRPYGFRCLRDARDRDGDEPGDEPRLGGCRCRDQDPVHTRCDQRQAHREHPGDGAHLAAQPELPDQRHPSTARPEAAPSPAGSRWRSRGPATRRPCAPPPGRG